MKQKKDDKAIILFDGVCNFCNSTINLVIRKDKKDHFRFAPLQSVTGEKILKENGVDANQTESVILYENGKIYKRSAAALRISRHMSGLYPLLYGFMLVPPFIRNAVYDWIAKNRYKWFGKRESCMVPTKEVREKFIV
jgi:predicted DCC family thiol-disulfide oxidoreductase YuxK